MIGEYVRWYGQLALIEYEYYGIASIKVVKTGQRRDVFLLSLEPTGFRVVQQTSCMGIMR